MEKNSQGNSQYLKQNRIMHHGCIMIDSNLIDVADALKPKEAKFESKSAKSVRSESDYHKRPKARFPLLWKDLKKL